MHGLLNISVFISEDLKEGVVLPLPWEQHFRHSEKSAWGAASSNRLNSLYFWNKALEQLLHTCKTSQCAPSCTLHYQKKKGKEGKKQNFTCRQARAKMKVGDKHRQTLAEMTQLSERDGMEGSSARSRATWAEGGET